jgi:hypothetical protein
VPGLRREEVAQLAGVSVDYYVRLEKGHLETASTSVLDAISRALQLDAAERSHLHSLARSLRGSRDDSAQDQSSETGIRPSLVWMLDAMSLCPAYIRNGRLDVLASNEMGRALYSPMFNGTNGSPNLAEFCFLDPAAKRFFPEWSDVAHGTVALLRAEAGRVPSDPQLSGLVERLSNGSDYFCSLWASHDVRQTLAEVKVIDHPRVGTLTLAVEVQHLAIDTGLTLVAYAAEPGSPSDAGLRGLTEAPAAGTDRRLTWSGE